jgi:hypothetical protein
VPREFLKRLDAEKAPYYSRNKYVLKILEEYLNENEQAKNLRGSRISSPATQAAVSEAATPTNITMGTPEAGRLSNMTTNRGVPRRQGDVATNEK